jgi:LysR family carnitine catabolism transcriptional activator
MTGIPVRQIQTLVCVADAGNFRLAAERLGLSQPAVSTHIRDLEQHFGVALVHRTTRRVSLTAEGLALAARARRAFQELELASQDVRDLAAVHRGRVVVACIPPTMAEIIPHVIRRLADEFPAVEIEIRDVLSREVEQLVGRGDADFGVGPQPQSATLAFNKLITDYFVAALPAGHVLACRKSIDLLQLLEYPLVALLNDTNARLILDQAIHRFGRSFTPRFELSHNFSAGRLVAAGLGIAIVPGMAISSLGAGDLKIANIKPRIFREIGVISRLGYKPSPSGQAFMKILAAEIERERSFPKREGRAAPARKPAR